MPVYDPNEVVHKDDCTENIKNFNKKMDEFKKDLNSFKLEIVREIAGLPDKLEAKFAPKWVADAMRFIMAAVFIVIIGALMALIVK